MDEAKSDDAVWELEFVAIRVVGYIQSLQPTQESNCCEQLISGCEQMHLAIDYLSLSACVACVRYYTVTVPVPVLGFVHCTAAGCKQSQLKDIWPVYHDVKLTCRDLQLDTKMQATQNKTGHKFSYAFAGRLFADCVTVMTH